MSQVFIAYSRKNRDLALSLKSTLEDAGHDVWIDLEDLPAASSWRVEIQEAIEKSIAFIYLLSLDSVNSQYCQNEFRYARELNKKIIPILLPGMKDSSIPAEVAEIQWLVWDDFEKDLRNTENLNQLIERDIEWEKFHAELTAKAKKWERTQDKSRLLRGKELAEAEERLTETHEHALPTELQRNYVLDSRRNEDTQRKRLTISFGIGLIVVAFLATFAWGQRNSAMQSEETAIAEANARATANANEVAALSVAEIEEKRAEEQAQIAFARRIAAPARSLYEIEISDQLLPVLLAIESAKIYPEIDATQILQTHILAQPFNIFIHDDSVLAIEISPDNQMILSGSSDGTARVWNIATGQEISRILHGDEVNAVAFTSNGKWAASGSGDGIIKIWDIFTGQNIAVMEHDGHIYDLEFSASGKWLVSSSQDGTARVWDVAEGKEISRMFHGSFVTAVAFSPDEKWVLSGGCDIFDSSTVCRSGTARVWEARTGKEVARINHDDGNISAVAFSPDGKLVASGGGLFSSNVRVWEASTGVVLSVMETSHENGIWDIAFDSSGSMVIAGGCDKRSGIKNPCYFGSARIWDVETGAEVSRFSHNGNVRSVAFSQDGSLAVLGGDEMIGRVWEVETGEEISQFHHQGIIFAVKFTLDRKKIISAAADGTVRTWDIEPDQSLSIVDSAAGYLSKIAFSPDSKWLLSDRCDQRDKSFMIPICISNYAHVWDVSTGEEISSNSHSDEISVVAFHPNEEIAASGSRDGVIVIWQAATGEKIAELFHSEAITAIAFSLGGDFLASGSTDSTVRVWDVVTGNEILQMAHDDVVTTVVFSPDGKYILSGSRDNTVRIWDLSTGNEIKRFLYEQPVTSAAFSPDGLTILAGSEDGTARTWDASEGYEIARMLHQGTVNDVSFIPDSDWVISISGDGTARVWDLFTGNEVARFLHKYGVQSMAVSTDGRWIASGEEQRPFTGAISSAEAALQLNSTVYIWEAKSGRETARLVHDNDFDNSVGIPGGVRAIVFSPDGKRVVSADIVGYVVSWLYRPEDLIDYACTHISRNFSFSEWQYYIGNEPYHVTCDPEIYPNAIIPEDAQEAYLESIQN